MVSVPEITLNSANTMPLLGMGTAVYPFVGSNAITSAILRAIEFGYRHFDTAAVYQTEQCLGEAIAQALDQGLIKSREELFITSKLWCSDAHADLVLLALNKTLRNLQLDYLDLYLIHLPVSLKPGQFKLPPPPKEDLMPMDIKSVWAAMEECQRLGLTRSIGVSNFSCKKLNDLLLNATIPPAVNQVEMNPLWQQKKVREFCKSKGIHVAGYSPLGARGTIWGTNRVMDCKELEEIAKARGKTIAQVCLRWVHEQGVIVLVKSFNEERMKENLDIFDWALSKEESQKISQFQQYSAFNTDVFVSADGPFKSVEEFWDGEI